MREPVSLHLEVGPGGFTDLGNRLTLTANRPRINSEEGLLMDTMNIVLLELMKQFVQERVCEGGYISVSEYVRELIIADQKRKERAGNKFPI